jgi:hypothetical protein
VKTLSLGVLTLVLALGTKGATISGTVTSDTGSPLRAMTVAAYTNAGALAASGGTTSSGTYSLSVPGGIYHLLAYDPAGAFATSFYADAESFETSASLSVTSTQSVTDIDFRLVRSGFIAGRVSSATDGASLPNVTVAVYNLSGTRRGFTSTGSTGGYTLALPPGTFKLVAYGDALDYAPSFFDGATSFATAGQLTVVAMESTTANFLLPPAAKITGTITDRATLAPLPAMRVMAYSSDGGVAAQSVTGSDGKFAMAARGGALRIVVDDPSGNYATTYVPDAESFSTQTAVTAPVGQTLTMNATMARGARLGGKVTDRTTGARLANITAVAYNADGTTRAFGNSDATGAYTIVVPAGDFRVGVFDSGLVYLPQFHPNQTTFAAAVPQHAIAQQSVGGLDFALTKGARVAAHVTSRTTGAPLAAITVGAYDPAGHLIASGTTDGSGDTTLLVGPASVRLLAFDTSLQFATAYYLGATTFESTEPVLLGEGASLSASFVMTDAGRIVGRVIDAATASPLFAIQVIVYDATLKIAAETFSDGSGTFRVAVPAGAYSIAAVDPAHRYATATSSVQVSTGRDTGPLQLQLSAVEPARSRRRAVRH